MDNVAYLIKYEYVPDDLQQRVPVEKKRTIIFVSQESITRQEWNTAGQGGHKPQMMLKTNHINYSGERVAEEDGVLYDIYRSYQPPGSDDVELYLELKAGVQ